MYVAIPTKKKRIGKENVRLVPPVGIYFNKILIRFDTSIHRYRLSHGVSTIGKVGPLRDACIYLRIYVV